VVCICMYEYLTGGANLTYCCSYYALKYKNNSKNSTHHVARDTEGVINNNCFLSIQSV
jgi:hypothetical protein